MSKFKTVRPKVFDHFAPQTATQLAAGGGDGEAHATAASGPPVADAVAVA